MNKLLEALYKEIYFKYTFKYAHPIVMHLRTLSPQEQFNYLEEEHNMIVSKITFN